MDTKDIEAVARVLRKAYATRKAIEPVRNLLPGDEIDTAYAVQKVNTDYWVANERRIAGYKIGLTNPAVQKQLGVDQPDFGVLFTDMAVCDAVDIVPADMLLQPKVEAEVAFVMGRDLCDDRLTVADIISATEYVLPAIEIVDSRIANWQISIVDTIADNASSGLFVLGNEPKSLRSLDLRTAGMAMNCAGAPVSTGVGLACLGHPVNAALWLAKMLARLGTPLSAGDLVLSGALGPMVPALPGNVYEARINGVGSVRAAFCGGEQA